MRLSMVPFAEPEDVLRCSWDLANGALLALASFSKMNRSLNPCFQVGLEFCREASDHLSENLPIKACDEVLMMWPLRQPGCSLVASFQQQDLLYFPPRVLEGELVLHQQRGGLSGPPADVIVGAIK